MKQSRVFRLKLALLVRFSRIRQKIRTVAQLISSGRFDLICSILRRRLFGARGKHLPVEFIDQGAITPAGRTTIPVEYDQLGREHTPGDVEPLVSIIIPCFNYGPFLQRAIDSILSQTLSAIEIIVVEGGSTDGLTPDIVRNLTTPKTRVIFQEEPSLVGENRNAGITAARGRFICCLDADDTLEQTYLEKAAYLLQNHFYDIVSTGMNLTGMRSGTIDVLESPDLKDMTQGNHITTCAVFRRDLWEKVGGYFDTGKGNDHVAEDWDFWLRCVASGARVRNITREHLFNYTIHEGGSLSSRGVRSVGIQRDAILERNKTVLTSAAFEQSKFQSQRRMVRVSPTSAAVPLMRSSARSLLVVVPLMIVGGAERLLSSVVKYLARKGWSVTIVSTLSQVGHEDASDWFRDATKEVYLLPRFLGDWEYASFLHYLIRTRRYDATLLAGSRFFYELLPELSSTYPDMAILDLLFNTEGHVHSHIEFKPFLTYALAENPEVISWFKKQGWENDRIGLVESGVDVETFDTVRSQAIVEALDIREEEIVIGYSGRLSQEKAPEVFLELVAAFRGDQKLRFVMTGGGPMQDYVEKQISKLPDGSNIDFKGLVDSTRDYFATYDVFVLPSRIDGRPIALMEALSSGCAVVASRVGGIPVLLEGSGAGILCAPAHTPDFVDAIRSLIDDEAKLLTMKSAARAKASQSFSIRQMGENYLSALEAAIRIKRGGAIGKN